MSFNLGLDSTTVLLTPTRFIPNCRFFVLEIDVVVTIVFVNKRWGESNRHAAMKKQE